MDNRKYDYFLSIYKLGNITKAAEKNYISQPSMTQYLNRLEDSIGMKLFDRSSTPLTLTKAGEYYREYVLKCMELDKNFQRQIDSLSNSVSGSIKVGIPLQMQSLLIPQIVNPFLEKYPQIDLNIQDDASPTLEDRLPNRLLDCALIYVQTNKKRSSALHYIDLEDEPLYLIANKKHPLAEGKESSREDPILLELDDIKEEYFYLLNKGFVVRALSDEFFINSQFVPNKIMSMTSMNAILNMIISKRGFAFMPRYMIDAFSKADQLAYFKVGDSDLLSMRLTFAYMKGKVLSNAANSLVEFIKEFYHL